MPKTDAVEKRLDEIVKPCMNDKFIKGLFREAYRSGQISLWVPENMERCEVHKPYKYDGKTGWIYDTGYAEGWNACIDHNLLAGEKVGKNGT